MTCAPSPLIWRLDFPDTPDLVPVLPGVCSSGAPAHLLAGLGQAGPGGSPERPQWALRSCGPSCLPFPWAGTLAEALARALSVDLTDPLRGLGHAREFIGTWRRGGSPGARLTNALTRRRAAGAQASSARLGGRLRETGGGDSAARLRAVFRDASGPALGGQRAPPVLPGVANLLGPA